MAGLRGWIFVVMLTVIIIVVIVSRIASGRLRAEYAMFWGILGLGLLPFGVHPGLVDVLAGWVGIAYAPSLLLVFVGLFSAAYLVHLSERVSEQRRNIKKLAQEVAFLRHELGCVSEAGAHPSNKDE